MTVESDGATAAYAMTPAYPRNAQLSIWRGLGHIKLVVVQVGYKLRNFERSLAHQPAHGWRYLMVEPPERVLIRLAHNGNPCLFVRLYSRLPVFMTPAPRVAEFSDNFCKTVRLDKAGGKSLCQFSPMDKFNTQQVTTWVRFTVAIDAAKSI